MSRAPFVTLTSRALRLRGTNVDTDQIIPARFLTTTVRAGLGRHLFADWRYAADGSVRPASPLDGEHAAGRIILVAGPNFGGGSSREHAVWALADFGFRAVVAPRLADIFRRNALGNGVLAVEIDAASHAALAARLDTDPAAEVTVDLTACEVRWPGGRAAFALEPFARHCLLHGVDELDYLLAQDDEIARHERAHPLPALHADGGVA